MFFEIFHVTLFQPKLPLHNCYRITTDSKYCLAIASKSISYTRKLAKQVSLQIERFKIFIIVVFHVCDKNGFTISWQEIFQQKWGQTIFCHFNVKIWLRQESCIKNKDSKCNNHNIVNLTLSTPFQDFLYFLRKFRFCDKNESYIFVHFPISCLFFYISY